MRKVLATLLIIFAFFLITNFSYAQTKTKEEITQERLEAKKLKMEQRMLEKQRLLLEKQEQKLEIKKQKSEIKEVRLDEIKQENIKQHYSNMHKKYLAMIERLEALIGRIETRIASIEETDNINLVNAKSEIARAKTLLDEAKADLAAVNNTIDQTLNSGSPKDAFSVIRDSLTDIKNKLMEIHGILVKIIVNIKGLRVGTAKKSPTVFVNPTSVPLTPTATVTPTPII